MVSSNKSGTISIILLNNLVSSGDNISFGDVQEDDGRDQKVI